MSTPHRRRAVGVLVSVLVAAACSSPDAERSPPPTAEPTELSTQPATASPARTATPPDRDPFELAQRYESPDVDTLVRRLVRAENTIRSGEVSPEQILEQGRIQQAAYRQLVRTPQWRDDAFVKLPRPLLDSARANVDAGHQLRQLTAPRTELPPWRIVEPLPSRELRSYYADAGNQFGIEWTYLAAIHLVETRMGRIRGTSIAGAKGPMQFLPSTWERWGKGDIEDASDSIHAAARYLHGHGAPKDIDRALFAYNRSDLYVDAIKQYAFVMRDDARTYEAYHAWDVYYRTTKGDALLYVGWPTR